MSGPTSENSTSASVLSAVHVTVVKNVPPENQAKWLEMGKELAAKSWEEDGCITYDIVRSKENPNRFVIVEEWASQPHLDAHFQTPHFQALVPSMDGISETVELDVSSKALPISRAEQQSDVVNNRKKRNGRILILYDTSTGSTAQIADLIAEGALLLDRIDVRVRVVPGAATTWEDPATKRDVLHPFATHADIFWADGIAAGTPTNLGGISYRMKQFWDEFSQAGGWGSTDGKVATAFTSQGGNGGGGELACMAMKTVLMNFGFSVFGISDYVGFLDTMHYGSAIAKKPRNLEDKLKCRRQGLRLAEFVAYYINGRDEANPIATKLWDTETWGFPGIPPRDAGKDTLMERSITPHISLTKRGATAAPKRALIFTKMEDYVHDATPAMASWVLCKFHEFGWKGVVTDDKDFIESEEKLSTFDVVVFLNNSGQIFTNNSPLLKHIENGKGVVGAHAAIAAFLNGKDASGATIMEPTSDIFETIFGSHFKNHPPVQTGKVSLSMKHALAPNLTSVPLEFEHTDEFFNFTTNVSDDPDTTIVAILDETTIEGGLMGEKHPLVWYRELGDNKAPIFYSALGHFSHFYNGTGGRNGDYVTTILEAGIRFCCQNSGA
eukprot:scaffold1869_cov122-Cylindrotheca_fusiformis.AAC.10